MKVGRLSRFIIVVVLTLFVLFLPTPQGLSVGGKKALSAFVFTSGIFALQPVSLPFSSLMVMVSLIALGISTSEEAFITLSRPIIILILGSLFLAEALRKHGLTRRLAMMSIVASNGKIDRLLFGMMGITAFLSMWMENTATSAVFIPVALTISNQIGDRERAQEVKKLLVLG